MSGSARTACITALPVEKLATTARLISVRRGIFLRSLSFVAVFFCCSLLPLHCFAQTEGIYQAQCASCHGVDGTPTDAGKNLGAADLKSAFVQDLTNEELFNSIATADNHKGYAHAFRVRGMTSQQIYDVVKYLRQMAAESKPRMTIKKRK